MFDFCDDTGLGLFPATWTSKSQSGVRRNSHQVSGVCLLRLLATKEFNKKQSERPATHEHEYFHHLESRISTTCVHRPSAHLPIIAIGTLIRTKQRIFFFNNASRITISLRDSNVKRRQRSDSQPSDNCIHRSIEQVFF